MLSFDLEEFDLPLEYDQQIDIKNQQKIAYQGAVTVAQMLDELGAAATFFTTARFALEHKPLMRELSKKHEIASHSFNHSSFVIEDLQRSREVLEDITGMPVRGFRRPRFAQTDQALIEKAGYVYDSSINPIWLPGRYNQFFAKRNAHFIENLLIIPISATPLIRFPLFWLSLKNMSPALMKPALSWTLGADEYVNIFFHPWEFTSAISQWDLPKIITRCSGQNLVERVGMYIRWLKQKGELITMGQFNDQFRLSAQR